MKRQLAATYLPPSQERFCMEKSDLIFYILFTCGFGGIWLLNFLARRNTQSFWVHLLYAPASGLRTDIANMTKAELMKSGKQFLYGTSLLFIFIVYVFFLALLLYHNDMPPLFVLISMGLVFAFMVLFLASSLVMFVRGLFRSRHYIPPNYECELVSKGLADLRDGNFEQGRNRFVRAVELAPDYVDAYVGNGMACAQLRDFESAQESYEQALKLLADQEYDKAMESYFLETKIFVLLLLGRDEEAEALVENPLFEHSKPYFWQYRDDLTAYVLPRSYIV
jgi:tetratricopeptide (TPR) repeat protein